MNDAAALASVRNRDRLLVLVLEAERSTGWPEPFDWQRWGRNREALSARLRADWQRLPRAHVVHKAVDR